MQEKNNVLMVLKNSLESLKREDVVSLKDLSNRTIHMSSIYQDADNVMVAVIIYALSKIVERKNYRQYQEWDSFIKQYENSLIIMITEIEKDNLISFRKQIQKIRKIMEKLEGDFKNYIKDVFKKAEINRASRIYEHGISMKKTADLLGISVWDLAEYAGQKEISDINLSITKPVKSRIKIAIEAFK